MFPTRFTPDKDREEEYVSYVEIKGNVIQRFLKRCGIGKIDPLQIPFIILFIFGITLPWTIGLLADIQSIRQHKEEGWITVSGNIFENEFSVFNTIANGKDFSVNYIENKYAHYVSKSTDKLIDRDYYFHFIQDTETNERREICFMHYTQLNIVAIRGVDNEQTSNELQRMITIIQNKESIIEKTDQY